MTKKKINQLTELPPELVIWVNAENAAAMLDYAQEKFNEIRYSEVVDGNTAYTREAEAKHNAQENKHGKT